MTVTINGSTGITFPAGGTGNPAGTVVGTSDSQTLTNKTFSGTQTFGTATFAQPSGSAPLSMARAWVQFNGTAATVTGSSNFSSITRGGAGSYTAVMTTAMPDTNYAAVFGCTTNTSGGLNATYCSISSTTNIDCGTYSVAGGGAGAYRDTNQVCLAVFR